MPRRQMPRGILFISGSHTMIDLSPSRTRRVVIGYGAQLHASQAGCSEPATDPFIDC